MIATPASAERMQKCVFNFEINRLLKKRPIYPILPYLYQVLWHRAIRSRVILGKPNGVASTAHPVPARVKLKQGQIIDIDSVSDISNNTRKGRRPLGARENRA